MRGGVCCYRCHRGNLVPINDVNSPLELAAAVVMVIALLISVSILDVGAKIGEVSISKRKLFTFLARCISVCDLQLRDDCAI